MRPGEELKDGPPIHGNTRLEIIWTAIPAILLVGLCTYAYIVLTDIEKAPAAEPMNVRVVGEQFTWTFYYQGEGGKEIASPQLYLPSTRPVYFTVQSKDVLHDFWVPAFRMKIDAVPGIDTHLRVTPNRKLGDYPVVCAELCGLGHSTMRQTAHVLSQADFDKRLAELQQAGRKPAGGGGGGGGSETDGKTLFTQAAEPAARPATRSPTRAPPARPARTSTRRPQGQGRGLHQAVDRGSERQDRARATRPGSCRDYGETLSDAQVDALVKYLRSERWRGR